MAGKERRGSWGVVDGEEDPEMSMLLLLASSQGMGQRKDPNYNTCVAYKFLTRIGEPHGELWVGRDGEEDPEMSMLLLLARFVVVFLGGGG